MVRYEPALSERMRQPTEKIRMYGTEIELKAIPDESRPGVYDPREFEMVKARADAFTKMQNADSGAPAAPTIEDMRRMMGFPNLNMNTVEIWTKYVQCEFDGNPVGIWVHWPRKPEDRKNRPGFLYIHGGGWVGGTPYTVENPCRLLAERADCVVFNIDYSLAPEKPYPNGLNDCFSALRYIWENAESFGVDRNRIGMGGDSAGGNLTAACAIRDREEGTHMLCCQALIYPAVVIGDSRKVPAFDWKLSDYEMDASQAAYIEPGLSLGRPVEGQSGALSGVAAMYLQHGEDVDDPLVSPLMAPSKKGLCRALVAVAEFDGLRIQGEVYGAALREAGVDVRILRYRGVGHAFLDKLGVLPQAEDLVQEMANLLLNG